MANFIVSIEVKAIFPQIKKNTLFWFSLVWFVDVILIAKD